MNTWVILLRGVMPMGKNKVPMAQLRQVLTKAGFEGVRTYIQSGNALVRTALSAPEVEKRVHDLIKEHIGADLVVVARTGAQLQKILDGNPFPNHDISRVFFTVLAQTPLEEKVKAVLSRNYAPEEIVITDEAAYLFIPGSAARSQLSNNYLEKKLGVSATTRNFNTMKKMIELSEEK
ncbi:MAG: DUF1697 domain-containing protein [Anaerolineales bacterium]